MGKIMKSMGFNLWIWTALALSVFWSVGVYNRITRLRARSVESFAVVAQHLLRYHTLVSEHVDMKRVDESPPAFQQLLLQLEEVERAIKAAHIRPWDRELLTAVTQAATDMAVNWGVLRTAPADLAGAALPEKLTHEWDGNSHLLDLGIASFNQILLTYSTAIEQFPALVIANFLGFKPPGKIVMFHEV